MLRNLLESKPQKPRTTLGMLSSVSFHTVILVGASYATLRATPKAEQREQNLVYVEPRPEPTPPPPKLEVAVPAPANPVPALPTDFIVLTAPVNVPDSLPTINLRERTTDANDFLGKGLAGGASTVPRAAEPTGQYYFESQVEKPVMQAPHSVAPRYPEILKSAGVEGEVVASFVVDATGHVEPGSFQVLRATHSAFVAAVRNALPSMAFLPAEIGGQKVRQLVQQPFVFAITR